MMSAKSVRFSVMATVLAASLAACGQGQQQSSAAPRQDQQQTGIAPSSVASSQPDATLDTNVAGATLMVQPASIDGCTPNQPIVATVSWRSPVPKNRVMVTSPGQVSPQLFSESGYSGSAKTGEWVVNGTRFALIDASNQHLLAERTVTMTPCSSANG